MALKQRYSSRIPSGLFIGALLLCASCESKSGSTDDNKTKARATPAASATIKFYGLKPPESPPLSLQAEHKACAEGSGETCGKLGSAYLNRDGHYSDKIQVAKGDPKMAAFYLNAACERGYLPGCTLLGYRYQLDGAANQTEVTLGKDLSKAITYKEKACKLGDPESCFDVQDLKNKAGAGGAGSAP